jgi:hypothetical protein
MPEVVHKAYLFCALICAVVFLGVLLPVLPAHAASPPLSPLSFALSPLSSTASLVSDDDDEGGWIEIYVLVGNWQEPWTVVQWKDALGGWNDVAGWRGQFDMLQNGIGYKTWEVDPANFGMAPMRWIVYEKASGAIVAKSDEFSLPTEIGQTVTLEVIP